MKQTDGRLAGILGTVIIHLIVGIIVMVFQIRELHVKANLILDLELFTEYENEFENRNEEFKLPESSLTTITTIERALQGDAELLNIARNLASTASSVISREEYIDMVKDELIRSGQLGVDNYIDQGRRGQSSNSNNENYVPVRTTVTREEARRPLEREAVAANYEGRTTIEYSLEGRTHTYLPIPIHKCQGAGLITLRIEVKPRGDVEKATVLASESVTDQCLIETAINSALITRFNSDINAPKIQTGTLAFQFVAQ
jgi:hypothetical protein